MKINMNMLESIVDKINKQYDKMLVKKLLLIREKALRDGELTIYNILNGIGTKSIETIKQNLEEEGFLLVLEDPSVVKYENAILEINEGTYSIKMSIGKVKVMRQIYEV